MNEQEQLRLQAYLDGELTPRERADVAQLLDQREDARDLLAELQHTRAAVRGNEVEHQVAATREFYWNRIAREIEAGDREPAPSAATVLAHWLGRHLTQLAGAGAGVALVALAFTLFSSHQPLPESEWEVLHPDTGMVNYRDYQNGITVVLLYDRTTPGFTSAD